MDEHGIPTIEEMERKDLEGAARAANYLITKQANELARLYNERDTTKKVIVEMERMKLYRGLLLNKYEELLTKEQQGKAKKEVQVFMKEHCRK